MNILSLFDGISCARVALERAGLSVRSYRASEIDKYAIQISKKNYPDIIQLGDVKSIHGRLGTVDLLIGGSPCQDLSIAKKDRKGLDGSRSGLFWEYVRILEETEPRYFILENVASMSKKDKDIITETLGVKPIMINAALVSAQNRKRLFWTNIPNVELPVDRGIFLKDIIEEDVDEKYFLSDKLISGFKNKTGTFANRFKPITDVETTKSPTITARYFKMSSTDPYISTKRVGDIGNGGQGERVYDTDGKSVAISANGGGMGAKTGLYLIRAAAMRGRNLVDGKRVDIVGAKTEQVVEIGQEKANTITSVTKDSMVLVDERIRRLTPLECERLQCLPDGYTKGVSDTQRYKCLGNAFNVDVVAHILSYIKYEINE